VTDFILWVVHPESILRVAYFYTLCFITCVGMFIYIM
jgi:hypothetical protein